MTEPSPPPNSEGLSVEQAQSALDGLETEISLCGSDHPYCSTINPKLHKQYVDSMYALRLVATGEKTTAEVNPLAQAAESAMAEQQTQVDGIGSEIAKELDLLEDLGFEGAEVPDEPQQYHLDTVRSERMNAQHDFDNLAPLLRQGLNDVGESQEVVALFDSFSNASFNAELKETLASQIIKYIHQNKQRKG